ncbi:cytosolic protein [Candidatus Parcubacteria bacterium]|nr:MAG: cytosolic protein [Candidatus Parcubacteria bacterium]
MTPLVLNDVRQFVAANIGSFHARRLQKLEQLRLKNILQRKNPYLFRAKNVLTAQDLVRPLLDAYLSSQEETLFGEFLEQLAIFVCSQVYGGRKSSAEGIDLEFSKGDVLYIVSVKSGPNWGNSSQIKRMIENFRKAKRILRSNNPGMHVVAVNGCCYGRDTRPDKGDYWKLCGQNFWYFISGNERLYLDIVEPLGHQARERNEAFEKAYARVVNRFTSEILQDFCDDGVVNWEKLVAFSSSVRKEVVQL